MISYFNIPTEIVNYICELAAGTNKLWYPIFSPKTGKLTWKLNKYVNKFKLKLNNILPYKINQSIIRVNTLNTVLFYAPFTFVKYYIKYKLDFINLCIGKFIHYNNNYNIAIQVCTTSTSNVDLSASPIEKTYIYENNIAKYQILQLKKYKEINEFHFTVRVI